MFRFVEESQDLARIKVIGVGGAGGNAVNRMIEAGLEGVEFLAVNTDAQALRLSRAHQVLQIGSQLTRGLGSGGDPRVGRKAIEEDEEAIVAQVRGCDMVFVTCGMGGGTGTGAAPVIARIARDLGVLTVGIVTRPFAFEGGVRMRQADEGIEGLQETVDTLIIIPNQRLLEVVPPSTSVREAFQVADNVLYEATRGIYEIISRPNHVNLDFADVRTIMKGMGVALMGTGRAEGEGRAEAAAQAAISSPLLQDVDIRGARGVLVNLLGGEIGIAEISEAMGLVQEAAGEQANIIFGYGTDESLGDTLQVTVVATGFERGGRSERALRPVTATRAARPSPADAAPDRPDAPAAAADPEPAAAEEPVEAPVAAEPTARAASPERAGGGWTLEDAAPEPSPAAGGEPAGRRRAPAAELDEEVGRRQRGGAGGFLSRLVRPVRVERIEAPPPSPEPTPPRFRGFGALDDGEDLSRPAYTRKYLD